MLTTGALPPAGTGGNNSAIRVVTLNFGYGDELAESVRCFKITNHAPSSQTLNLDSPIIYRLPTQTIQTCSRADAYRNAAVLIDEFDANGHTLHRFSARSAKFRTFGDSQRQNQTPSAVKHRLSADLAIFQTVHTRAVAPTHRPRAPVRINGRSLRLGAEQACYRRHTYRAADKNTQHEFADRNLSIARNCWLFEKRNRLFEPLFAPTLLAQRAALRCGAHNGGRL